MGAIDGIKDGHAGERLSSDQIIWLGTVRPDGRPHMVPVWFDWDGENLTIFSQPNNQKIRNIRHESRVTVAIDDTRGGGDVLLFEGDAALSRENANDVVTRAYIEKYSEGMKSLGMDVDRMMSEYSQVIRVHLTRFMGW